ncbi:P-loop containing nucleoside triphosphate hydrolase protein [Viridothelium virens]|uniref:P-loop containing nucleoside triphosphate hydrolase protein n=1 Tax=Viridothelium virens TaxID=1048519 RepID=A0A6A6HPY8_VIRVR|nr:P-loop containing nucleoside triphosphate hydrolase protein [Viridothelium virens]
MDALDNKSKQLVSIINELERLGIEKSQIPLPKIVVVGDQSAGKSSIVEAISGIKVPRASGTCTRCPIQITMTSNSDPTASWTCKLSLLKTHDYAGPKHLLRDEAELWEPKYQPDSIHLQTITDKDDVEHFIKLAQDAVLSPTTDPEDFFKQVKGRARARQPQEKFSPNAVCLDISDRDIPNLSFCDLPGIINQMDSARDEYLVEVVRELVEDRIEGENTLILLACSMGSDIHTSSAASIIRRTYGSRAADRCLAVLTKPDLLQSGDDIENWRRILNGETFQFGHGYYVTKQPSPAELERKIEHHEAREKEQEFFASTKPWTTELAEFKALFGTDNLRNALAKKLAAIIEDSLPVINEKITERLSAVKEALDQFPPIPTANSYGIVSDVLNQFTSTLQENLEGVYPHTQFRMEWRNCAENLRDNLLNLRPDVEWNHEDPSTDQPMRQSDTPTPTPRKNRPEVVELLDDEPSRPIGRQGTTTTPQRKRKLEHGDIATPNGTPQSHTSTKKARTRVIPIRSQKLQLEKIKQTLVRVSLSGIPDEYDSKALDQLILESFQLWDAPIDKFLESIRRLMGNLFRDVLENLFKPYYGTPLYDKVHKITGEFITLAFMSFNSAKDRALRSERFKPITLNREILTHHLRAHQRYLETNRFKERANLYIDRQEMATGRSTDGQDRAKKLTKEKDVILKDLGEDEFHAALKVLAKVRAYYDVAAPRFIDNICLTVQSELYGECKQKLLNQLKIGLEIDQPDLSRVQEECITLLSQEPDKEAQRIALTREKEALEQAQRRLRELPMQMGQFFGPDFGLFVGR